MKRIYFLLFLALGMASCVDDEGNYSYTDLNEIAIDNIKDSYNVLSMIDRLQISPDITDTYGHDLSNYSFKWQICSGSLASTGYHKHTVIGEQKDLDWSVDLDPGSYMMYFIITDRSTGIESINLISLSVSHPATRGFLILGEIPDQQRVAVDMLSIPAEMDTIIVEDAIRQSDLSNLHKPEYFVYSGYHYNGHTSHVQTLWLMSDDKAYRYETDANLNFMGEFNDLGLFDTDLEVKRPAKLIDMFPHQGVGGRNLSGSVRGYMTEDMIIVGQVTQAEYFITPVNLYSTSSTELFRPAPYAFYDVTNSYTAYVFYDTDKKQFCHLDSKYGFPTNCTIIKDRESDVWSWQTGEEGRDLIYGENPRASRYQTSYAIMKDANDDFFIYGFKVVSNASGSFNKTLYTVDKSVATDFDKAERYMFSPLRTSVFYTVGSRLYQYDFSRGYIGYHDFGDEITYLEQDFCSDGAQAEYFVATYSDQNKGKIYKLEVTSNPDAVEFKFLEGEEWNTRLKVSDMEWKYGV